MKCIKYATPMGVTHATPMGVTHATPMVVAYNVVKCLNQVCHVTHMGHSIPNQHEIDMTSSDFFVICYT